MTSLFPYFLNSHFSLYDQEQLSRSDNRLIQMCIVCYCYLQNKMKKINIKNMIFFKNLYSPNIVTRTRYIGQQIEIAGLFTRACLLTN